MSGTAGTPGNPISIRIDNESDVSKANWSTEKTLADLLRVSKSTGSIIGEMAKTNKRIPQEMIDRITKSLDEGTGKIEQAGENLTKAVREGDRDRHKQQDEMDRKAQYYEEIRSRFNQNMIDGLRNIADQRDPSSIFSSFGQNMKNTSSEIKRLGYDVGKFGIMLGIAGMALDLIGRMYGRLVGVSDAMNRVYGGGVLVSDGLAGLVTASSAAGLSIDKFADMLSRNGAVAVSLGSRNMTMLAGRFSQMTRFGGNLMMNQEEGMNAFLEVMEMMRVSGEMTGLSNEQLTQRGVGLLNNFNELAIATGRNRDELRKQTAELMRTPLTSLFSRLLPPDARRRFTDLQANLLATFGGANDVAGRLSRAIERVGTAGGGFGLLEDDLKPLLAIVPGFGNALQDASIGVRSGRITQQQAIENLAKSFDNLNEGQLRMLSQANPQLAAFVEQILQGREQSKRAQEQLREEARSRGITLETLMEERRQTEERMKAIRGGINSASAALTRLGNSFSQIAANLSGILIPIMDVFTVGIRVVAGAFEILAKVVGVVADGFGAIHRFISTAGGLFTAEDGGSNQFASAVTTVGMVGILGIAALAIPAVLAKLGAGAALGTLASVAGLVAGRVGLSRLGGGAAAGAAAGAGKTAAAAGAASRVGGFLGSMGPAAGGIMSSMADGLKSMGAGGAAILKGAGVVAGVIAILSVGIGASAFILGSTLPKLADGLKPFAEIDGGNLIQTGLGMTSLSAGLLALTGANIATGLGNLLGSILSFGQQDPVERLRRFADIGPPLQVAASAISHLAEALFLLRETDIAGIRGFEQLASGLSSLTSLDLASLSGVTALLNASRELSQAGLDNLATVAANPVLIESLRTIASNIQTPVAPPGVSADGVGPATPVIASETINERTLLYYDMSIERMDRMIMLLEVANRDRRSSTSTLESSIGNMSSRV